MDKAAGSCENKFDEADTKETPPGSQFRRAMLGLQSKLEGISVTNVAQRSKTELPKVRSRRSFGERLSATSPTYLQHKNVIAKKSDKSSKSKSVPKNNSSTTVTIKDASDETNAEKGVAVSEALRSFAGVKSIVEGIQLRVDKLQGTRLSKQYEHLKESLMKCEVELDNIDTLGVVSAKLARKEVFRLIKEVLIDLDEKADSNYSEDQLLEY